MVSDKERRDRELAGMSAYISHIDNCDAGCRPLREKSYTVGFIPGTGQGCIVGKRLAVIWENSQQKEGSNGRRTEK